jgi:metal-responsive CopG/Arc/MetJ family transcriptional regulator
MTLVILSVRVKTAISVPDATFQAAERVAKRLALSRSELYSRALAQYLVEHSHEGVTAALDRVYSEEPSTVEPGFAALQRRTVGTDRW